MDPTNECSEFTEIPLAAVRALVDEESVDFEVFIPGAPGTAPTLYRAVGVGLTQPDFSRMGVHGVASLLVRTEDYRRAEETLEDNLTTILTNQDVSAEDKAVVVHRVGASVARDLLANSVDSEHIDRASSVVDAMIGGVLNDPLVAASLLEMAAHERSTASHMFVVATLGVMLGAEVFGPEQETLNELGMAGMLHDIGKLSIGADVLNKTETLTHTELGLVHQHPIESVRLIGENPGVTSMVRQMILQHHERIDGKGYPLGLDGSALLPQSKLLSIVDSFHAMIGHRPYRAPMTPFEANRVLGMQAGRQFDPDLVACWTELFERSWSSDSTARAQKVSFEPDELSPRHEHNPAQHAIRHNAQRRPRFACNGKTSVQCIHAGRLIDATAGPDEFAALAHDVSRGGLCIYTAHPMYRGEVVRIKIDTQKNQVWLDSVVAWCRRQDECVYRIGLRFVERITESQTFEPSVVKTMTELQASQRALCGHTPDGKPAKKISITGSAATGKPGENALDALAAIESMRKVNTETQNTAITLAMSGGAAVRLKAVDVLAGIKTRAARSALLSLLGDVNAEIREQTAAVVGTLKVPEAFDPLRKLLSDPVPSVALRAAGALGKLGDNSGLSLVARLLEDDCPETRLAAKAFGEITGHRFAASREGIAAARRYLAAKKPTLVR